MIAHTLVCEALRDADDVMLEGVTMVIVPELDWDTATFFASGSSSLSMVSSQLVCIKVSFLTVWPDGLLKQFIR